jgi:hypothetical protein
VTAQITPREIARRFRRLRVATDANIRNLNHGGCGFFAVECARVLYRLGIREVEIVTPQSYYGVTPRARVDEGCTVADLNRGHVGVRWRLAGNIYTADSEQARRGGKKFSRFRDNSPNHGFPTQCDYPFGQGLTIDEMAQCYADQDAWNKHYDRRQNKLLRALIETYLFLGAK